MKMKMKKTSSIHCLVYHGRKRPSGAASHFYGQSGGSGFQDLGPKSHAGHDREVYRDCHRLIRAGLENHR
jgi:hypothetical protein